MKCGSNTRMIEELYGCEMLAPVSLLMSETAPLAAKGDLWPQHPTLSPSLHPSPSPAKWGENLITQTEFRLKLLNWNPTWRHSPSIYIQQQIKENTFIWAQTRIWDGGNRCSRAIPAWESFAVSPYLWIIFVHTNTHPLPSLKVRKSAPVKHR